MTRLIWCLNNKDNEFLNTIFSDESRMQTCRFGIMHMRLPSSRPHASAIKPRDVKSVNMWLGISWEGATRLAVLLKIT